MRLTDGGTSDISNLVDLLKWRAQHQENQIGFTFLVDGESVEESLTFGELDRRARIIAAHLKQAGVGAEPVLMLYPAGLDFIAAFFGIMYAGAIAVPLYPPHRTRPDERLAAVIEDSAAKWFMTSNDILAELPRYIRQTPTLAKLQCIAADESIDSPTAFLSAQSPSISDIAFLQYSSGSTGSPKGVMVSHRNLMANLELIKKSFGHTENYITVGWLPLFHDMGLIGNVLEPLYVSGRLVFMSPVHFLQEPMRWLRAISHYKASTSGGPNFSFDYCVRRSTPEQRNGLDLSSWKVAFNGAEPVRLETIDRFAEAFGPQGFRRTSFLPCYGMAEATLLVAGGDRPNRPVSVPLDSILLLKGEVQKADQGKHSVGCGRISDLERVRIVNPDTMLECPPGRIGEIWLSSDSVAEGYWRRPEDTREKFGATLLGTEGVFLRTGDLGFIYEDELHIAGRLKDVIIVRGANYYPQDIEDTVEVAHPAVRHSGYAAFSIDINEDERLVIACEVEREHLRKLDAESLCKKIQSDIFERHGLRPHAIALLRPGSIPKTSSGKIRRSTCKQRFLDGSLDVLCEWRDGKIQSEKKMAPPITAEIAPASESAQSLTQWIRLRLAEYLTLDPTEIGADKPFAEFGVDSLAAVRLSGELEQRLGRRLRPTLLYECPTINALVAQLGNAVRDTVPTAPPPLLTVENTDPIALVGMSCRFPGADGTRAFWKLLCESSDAIIEVPKARWDADEFYDASGTKPGKMNTRWGGFLNNVDKFDEEFFGISSREATLMDPQQRLLLELGYEALEDAGIPSESLKDSLTGVFIGICNSDYGALVSETGAAADPRWLTGNAFSIAANRISYAFDFKGPSLAIDTACSSSLVAVHLACQSLRRGEATLALAGGVNLILKPDVSLGFSAANGTSRDGRCKAFGADANGMVRSEGAGLVVLKRLSQAVADGDQVYAVILGSAINHDGLSNGLTAPSQKAQEAVLRAAYAAANRPPERVEFIEAHGTGTILGDPIEAYALGAALAIPQPASRSVLLGSVKSNIGHTEAAAGVASLIKVALALRHASIPASLHSAKPNPHIPFEHLGLRVQQAAGPWPASTTPHLAGVSAFGFGGTNAHVVVEEAPTAGPATRECGITRTVKLLPVSARTPQALRELAQGYLDWIEDPTRVSDLDDLCYTAAVRRDHHECRLAIVFETREELIERLRAFIAGELLAGVSATQNQAPRNPMVAFVFSGHRGQSWGLSREFLNSEQVFLAALEQCEELFNSYVDWSLIERLCGEDGYTLAPEKVDVYHPCQFAYQVALAALWRSLGVEPHAIVGHSFGEVAAAHVAGVLSLEDATRIIFLRSRCLQAASDTAADAGVMASVELPRHDMQAILDLEAPGVSIAVNNSPTSVVLSGSMSAIDKLLGTLRARNVFCSLLPSAGAGHTRAIPVGELLELPPDAIRANSAEITLVSSVLGKAVDGRELDLSYWIRNVQETVLFADAATALIDRGCNTFIEVAPYPPVLSYSLSQCLRAAGASGTTLPNLRRNANETAHLLGALGTLYTQGFAMDWNLIYPVRRHCLSLPSYPWQRKRFWLNVGSPTRTKEQPSGEHALLKKIQQFAADPSVRFWEVVLDTSTHPFLADHRVQGAIILPTTAYLELALAAGRQVFGQQPCMVHDLEIRKAMFLTEHEQRIVQIVLTQTAENTASIRFFSRTKDALPTAAWICHASLGLSYEISLTTPPPFVPGDEMAPDGHPRITADEHYRALLEKGIAYGPAFQGVKNLWQKGDETTGLVQLPAALTDDVYLLHPALLDACLQVLAGQLHRKEGPVGQQKDLFLPIGVERLRIYSLPTSDAVLHSRARLRTTITSNLTRVVGDVQIVDTTGRVMIEVDALTLERVGSSKALAYRNADSLLYDIRWEKVPRTVIDHKAVSLNYWVIFADLQVAPQITAALEQRGADCLLVHPGSSFAENGTKSYQIDAGNSADYSRLMAHCVENACGRQIRVLHFWNFLTSAPAVDDLPEWAEASNYGCLSVLYLVQAITTKYHAQKATLSIITHQGQAIEHELVSAQQSMAWGLGKVIAFEHPELACGLVDFSGDMTPEGLRTLLEELMSLQGKTLQVALRTTGRFEPRLHRVSPDSLRPRIKATWAQKDGTLTLHADATYMLTGGLGGIGLKVAQWLCQRGARHLVLVGRSSPSGSTAEVIRQMEAQGVQVYVAQADVAERDQLADTLAQITDRMPPLRGIVHAAAVVDPGLLRDLDASRLRKVLAPKVGGALNLHSMTAGLPLDFFVMFSSVASLFGTPGQGNYVAANAYLDGLAHQRRAQGLPALSINWGGWAEVGLAARSSGAAANFAMRGFDSMSPDLSLDMLERLLGQDSPQVAVMATNWAVFADAYPQIEQLPFFAGLLASEQARRQPANAPIASISRSELLTLPKHERSMWIRNHLSTQLAKSLGVAASEVDTQRPINTMGIDSLMALEIKNRIDADLNISVPIVKFLEGASVIEVTTILLDQLEATQALAAQPDDGILDEQTERPAQIDSVQAAQMLANIDQMSDAEVESLLASLESSEGNT